MSYPSDAAFPLYCVSSIVQAGMTKREHFAALAMQSLIINPSELNGCSYEHIIAGAVQMADLLINELAKATK